MGRITLERLGFQASDRVVIFHVDDMGIAHSANEAAFECIAAGPATCGSVIVPAPWFPEVAVKCRQDPNLDVGIHLTLTSDFDACEWRPLSTLDPKSGLLTPQGFMWRTPAEVVSHARAIAATREMRSQVQCAVNNGIDVTHVDTHAGTVLNPRFIQSYLKVGREFRVPAMLPRMTREELEYHGMRDSASFILEFLNDLEQQGAFVVDRLITTPLEIMENKLAYFHGVLETLRPGLTHWLFHPAKDSPELRALRHKSTERVQDYEAGMDPLLKRYFEEAGVQLIGYRQVREILRREI